MKTLQIIQERYYIRERYESSTSNVTTPDSLTQPSSTFLSFAIIAPPSPTAHNSPTYLSYGSTNLLILSAMAANGVNG